MNLIVTLKAPIYEPIPRHLSVAGVRHEGARAPLGALEVHGFDHGTLTVELGRLTLFVQDDVELEQQQKATIFFFGEIQWWALFWEVSLCKDKAKQAS